MKQEKNTKQNDDIKLRQQTKPTKSYDMINK